MSVGCYKKINKKEKGLTVGREKKGEGEASFGLLSLFGLVSSFLLLFGCNKFFPQLFFFFKYRTWEWEGLPPSFLVARFGTNTHTGKPNRSQTHTLHTNNKRVVCSPFCVCMCGGGDDETARGPNSYFVIVVSSCLWLELGAKVSSFRRFVIWPLSFPK